MRRFRQRGEREKRELRKEDACGALAEEGKKLATC
jgi:hypothetical protein